MGAGRRLPSTTRSLFTSYDAKLASLGDVVSRHRRQRHIKVPYEELLDVARRLSVTRAPREMITVHAIPKPKGNGFRVVNEFGLIDAARQRLVQVGITSLLKASDTQFGRAGRGRNEAVQRVSNSASQRGHEWVVVCDLRSFFSSVSRDWLKANLPVGEKVVASVILAEGDQTIIPQGHDHPSINISMEQLATLGRSGLPQGARTSSVVGTHVVASVLEEVRLSACVVLTVYVDDFVITAPTQSEALRAFDALRDAFSRHPAGTFAFSDSEPQKYSDGFIYLGYNLSIVDGKYTIQIPWKSGFNFFEKLYSYFDDFGDKPKSIIEFRNWFKGYLRSHEEADNFGIIVNDAMNDLYLGGEMLQWTDPNIVWASNFLTMNYPHVINVDDWSPSEERHFR